MNSSNSSQLVNNGYDGSELHLLSPSNESRSNGVESTDLLAGKSIYMVSDGTGWTAEHSVNAALGQFDYCLVDRVCPVNTHLFSGVSFILFCFRKLTSFA